MNLYFALICGISAKVIDDFKEVQVVSSHWDAMLNKVSLSPMSLGNCATTVAKIDKAHLFEYLDQERKCIYAEFQGKGMNFWHSNLDENWTKIYVARHFWAQCKHHYPVNLGEICHYIFPNHFS